MLSFAVERWLSKAYLLQEKSGKGGRIFAIKKSRTALSDVDKVNILSRNQDFDLFKQKKKQTCSGGRNAWKPAVFLGGNQFRLRVPFGKTLRFPNPSAARKLFCLKFEVISKGYHLFYKSVTDFPLMATSSSSFIFLISRIMALRSMQR